MKVVKFIIFFFTLIFSVELYALTKEEALHILGSEVLQPSSSMDQIVARMVPAPLSSGIVEPGFGGPPTIDIGSISGNPQWFSLIDLFPGNMFEHDVIYVFIDDVTGTVTAFPAEDWPNINGIPMGQSTIPGTELILVFPLLPRPSDITPGTPTTEPFGDYGDAPDGQLAYSDGGVIGKFPTFFATPNSVLGRPGAHMLTTELEMLGQNVSVEQDVVDPTDPDGVINMVDADSDERMFLSWDPNTTPATSYLIYDVTVDNSAPDVDRFVNVLFDFDRSGDWSGAAGGTEWVVVNQVVSVTPGTTATLISPTFLWGAALTIPTQVWARVALTRSAIDPAIFGTLGWDGSGAFDFGEVEDFEVYLREYTPTGILPPTPPPPGQPNPPDPPGGGGPVPPCPGPGWNGIPIKCFAIVVQGNDNPGQTFVREAADTMEGLLNAQNYSTTRLSGANATEVNIKQEINNIKNQIICQDRILIFFIAHGRKDTPGGLIRLSSTEILVGMELNDALSEIEHCQNENCDEPEKSCDLTVLMESCYAAQWLDALPRIGRRIIASSDRDEPSWSGSDLSGGEYSDEFNKCSGDINNDNNGDGFVNPSEAHACAKNNLSTPRPQTPQIDDQTCECICPCDVDEDGDIDKNDISAILAARGTLVGPGDPRDTDGDGIITVRDAKICIPLCTNPRCAP